MKKGSLFGLEGLLREPKPEERESGPTLESSIPTKRLPDSQESSGFLVWAVTQKG